MTRNDRLSLLLKATRASDDNFQARERARLRPQFKKGPIRTQHLTFPALFLQQASERASEFARARARSLSTTDYGLMTQLSSDSISYSSMRILGEKINPNGFERKKLLLFPRSPR